MRKMKDSGVEWIAEIPNSWEIKKFKYFFDIIGGNGFKDEFQGNETGEIPFCKASDINGNSKYVSGAKNYVSYELATSQKYNIIPANSILISKIGEALRKNHRKINTIPCIVDNNCEAFTTNRDDNIVFLYYVMKYVDMNWFDNGGTIPSVNNSKLKEFYLPFPNILIQEKLAKYLDEKCAKIDKIIEKQQAAIEKLKEYKLSIITEAVTKGLNPDVVMNDSGVKWIGKIPLNWNVTSLGALSISMRNGYVGPTRDIFYDEGIPYIQSLHVKDGTISFEKEKYFVSEEWGEKHPKVYEGQLLIVQTGDIGQVGLVSKEMNGYNCHALIIVTVNEEYIMPTFLSYYLRSHVGKELLLDTKTGALLPHLNSGKIKVTPIVCPSIEEQSEIVKFLNQKCSCINEIISKKEVILGKLHDYKKSLIYEVVTGKKEV